MAMSTNTISPVIALQAQAAVNLFLTEHLPDRFVVDQARFDLTNDNWRVLVILAYPVIGSIGKVGEVVVSGETEEILSYTRLEEMKRVAQELYQAHQSDIEAAFS